MGWWRQFCDDHREGMAARSRVVVVGDEEEKEQSGDVDVKRLNKFRVRSIWGSKSGQSTWYELGQSVLTEL